MKRPCVYIMASARRGTLYIGVTSDMAERDFAHHSKLHKGFTARYNVTRLVWMEDHPDMESAIQREKSLKRWRRPWKIELIEKSNPHWHRLHPETGEVIYEDWPEPGAYGED